MSVYETTARTLELHIELVQSAFLGMEHEPRLHAALTLQALHGLIRVRHLCTTVAAALPSEVQSTIAHKADTLAYPVEQLEQYAVDIKNGTAGAHSLDRRTAAIFVFYIGVQCGAIAECIRRGEG